MYRWLLALVVAALALTALPTAANARSYYADCDFTPRYKPHTIILACGDGNAQLKSIHWYRWGGSNARGWTRRFIYNDCDPYCAVGRFHRRRAPPGPRSCQRLLALTCGTVPRRNRTD